MAVVRCRYYIEGITEEVSSMVAIPAPSSIRVGELSFAVAMFVSFSGAVTYLLTIRVSRRLDRSPIAVDL